MADRDRRAAAYERLDRAIEAIGSDRVDLSQLGLAVALVAANALGQIAGRDEMLNAMVELLAALGRTSAEDARSVGCLSIDLGTPLDALMRHTGFRFDEVDDG